MRRSLNRGMQASLALLILIAAMGCQSQQKTLENRVFLLQNMDNNTEKMISLIHILEENQLNMNEDIRSLKAAQHTIAAQATEATNIICKDQTELRVAIQEDLVTLQQNGNNNTKKTLSLIQGLDTTQQAMNTDLDSLQGTQHSITTQVIPAQQQLAQQITETTEVIRQDQTDYKMALQTANAQLTQQVRDISQRQKRLELTTQTIRENGQALRKSHDQCLLKLTEFKKDYHGRQGELDLIKRHIATLDSSITAMLTGLNQFETSLKDMGTAQKTLLTLLRDTKEPSKTPDRASVRATEFFLPETWDWASTAWAQPSDQSQTTSP